MPMVPNNFSGLITFTRASGATFVGSNGLIQLAATNVPRFDYDPVTLAVKGLLIEEQRTNLLTYSEQFGNAAWTKTALNTTGTPPWINVAVVPDGTTTAEKLIEDTTNALHFVRQNPTVSAVAHTFSFYAKAAERTVVWATLDGASNTRWFDLTAVTTGGSTGNSGSSTITSIGNGWYRCTYTYTFTGTTSACFIGPALNSATLSYLGDGTSGLFIWGAQLEAGSFATSYIPTVASQVTRSAEAASVNTLSPWYNATEGTLYAEYSHATTSTNNPAAVSINANTSAEEIIIYGETTLGEKFFVRSGNVIQANITASAKFANGVTGKLAGAYKVNDFAASANGAAAVVDTSGSIPTVTQMNIGSEYNGTLPLNGHIRRITYYPRRLSNAELQALTV